MDNYFLNNALLISKRENSIIIEQKKSLNKKNNSLETCMNKGIAKILFLCYADENTFFFVCDTLHQKSKLLITIS